LAVTSVGGEILFIEATRMKGKDKLTVTGHLGEVMSESAQIAYSLARSLSKELGMDAELFTASEVHIHVPAGAVPKDGPSAGLPMAVALVSLFSGRVVRSDVGMTGEITLRGRILPVGGIKAKMLAAHRAGLKMVVFPLRNEPGLKELPGEVLDSMAFYPVERVDEVLDLVLKPASPARLERHRLPGDLEGLLAA
jgi:ATP-dependent Lon protease